MPYKPNPQTFDLPDEVALLSPEEQRKTVHDRVRFLASQPGQEGKQWGAVTDPNSGRVQVITPTNTITNFPTSQDVVNQTVQRALTTRAAAQPPAAPSGSPYLSPVENMKAGSRKRQEDSLMRSKDPNTWKVEWKSYGLGETPVLRRLTPQEQAQNWADMHTLVEADIPQGGGRSAMAPAMNVFGGGGHLDTPLLTQSRKDINPTVWNNYRKMTRAADEKLNQALATRANVPHSIEEAQQFVDSLGFDDRVGEHIERSMTRYMQNANPELYKEMIGQRKVQKANDASYVDWVRMSANPRVASLSPDEILAERTPESQYAFDRDPNAVRHMIGPDGTVIEAPKRVLGPEETAQQKFKMEQTERDLQGKRIDDIVAQSGGRMVKAVKPDGEPIAIPIEQYQKEQDKLERENIREDREATREQRDQAAEQRRAAADTPEEKRRQKLEDMAAKRRDRLEEIAYKSLQAKLEKGMIDEPEALKQYNAEMERIKTIAPLAGEAAAPAASGPAVPPATTATAPAEPPVLTPEQYATAPVGTKFKGVDGIIRVKKQ
jgi:hypothetical protein